MKKKQPITKEDKKAFCKYQFKMSPFEIFSTAFLALLLAVSFEMVKGLFNTETLFKTLGISYIISFVVILVLGFLTSTTFKVLFFKNIYTLDGHIFKRHVMVGHHHHANSQGTTTSFTPKARAISEDGGVTTDWIYYPQRYFKKGDAKVKLIIYKDKAIDFYLVD